MRRRYHGDGAVATTKTSKKNTSGKARAKPSTRTAKGRGNSSNGGRATSTDRSPDAYAYGDRIPIVADTLRVEFDGAATPAELYQTLRTQRGQFNTQRRVDATLRYDRRVNGDQSVLVRDGGKIKLRSARAVKAHQIARAEFRKSQKKS